jgi:hypothetical protein
VRIPETDIFFCLTVVRAGSGDLSLGVKRTGPEAHRSSRLIWRLIMCGGLRLLPPYTTSWPVRGQLQSGVADF